MPQNALSLKPCKTLFIKHITYSKMYKGIKNKR
jgi:hypothetical protein